MGQLLDDVMVGTEDWQERIGTVLRAAHDSESSSGKAEALLRAARIARRYAPEEVEAILGRAYSSDPGSVVVAALYEGMLIDASRTDAVVAMQREVLEAVSDPKMRADLAFRFGARWALRHQNFEPAIALLDEALGLDPSHEAAFAFYRDLHGTRDGQWAQVAAKAEELS